MILFIHLAQIAENEIKSITSYDQIYDEKLEKFLREEYPEYWEDIDGLLDEIKSFEIKNAKSLKVPKFTMQLYGFIYNSLMDFPACKFDFKLLQQKDF